MILRILFIFIFFYSFILSQQIDFHSKQNIKRFADFLFCENDYLRAIDEYEKYLDVTADDTVEYKIAYSFLQMQNYKKAIEKFSIIRYSSSFYESSKFQKLKANFLINDSLAFINEADSLIQSKSEFAQNALKLKYCSYLFSDLLPPKENFLIPFDSNEKTKISSFYDWKKSPPYKNEILAGILSAIVPGSGKIYTQNYGDGIAAFILTGLFGYLAYTNFDHDHDFRAWVFTGASIFFYAGNIYGSIASAQIFNAQINFEFNDGVRFFLEEKNYFTPIYEFCK
jgi:TM2 domain-containing membrane protein YozV